MLGAPNVYRVTTAALAAIGHRDPESLQAFVAGVVDGAQLSDDARAFVESMRSSRLGVRAMCGRNVALGELRNIACRWRRPAGGTAPPGLR